MKINRLSCNLSSIMKEFTPGRENLQECPKYFLGIVPNKRMRYTEPTRNKLPLHITLLPPFYNLWGSEEKLVKLIENCCSEISIFYIGLSKDLGFFRKGRIGYYHFDKLTTQRIKEVHTSILDKLRPGIGINSEFIGKEYKPHIFVRSIHSGDGKIGADFPEEIWFAYLCPGLELWKKISSSKDYTKIAKFKFIRKYFLGGENVSVIPADFKKYQFFEWPKRNKISGEGST